MRLSQTLSILAPTLNNTSLLTPFNGSALRPGALPDGSNVIAPLSRDIIANGTNITERFSTENNPFPPRSWLGYGLDMTTVTPVDIESVASNVLSASRVIDVDEGGTKQEVSGVQWVVPEGVAVSQDISDGKSTYVSYETGEDAAHSLTVDGHLAANYLAIEGDVSAGYAIRKTFQKAYQYSLFSFNQHMIIVKLEDYQKRVNEPLLKRRMSRIAPFNPRSAAIVRQYRSLFATLGSHIITSVDYGSRMQLTVWADNSDSTVVQNFNADVAAKFNGLTKGGEFDINIKGESQYAEFEDSVQKASSCLGGDPELASPLDSDPSSDGVFETFKQWVNTTHTRPNLMSFQTMTLWDLMSGANDSEVAARGTDVQDAFSWIVENPEEHQTKARLTITSDWGEIGLLTPSAFILRDPAHSAPVEAFFSSTKITWTSNSASQRFVEIEFIITNDGSPVDIELSHGSFGSTPGTGYISVSFDGISYTNEGEHDNNWNSQRYNACPVNPHPRVNAPAPAPSGSVATS